MENEGSDTNIPRRDFLKQSVAAGAIGAAGIAGCESGGGQAGVDRGADASGRAPSKGGRLSRPAVTQDHSYNGWYAGESLNRIAFPLGGMGAGMICLEGTGTISHVSLRHRPEVFNEPVIFGAICIKGKTNFARVLEGPVPRWKAFGADGTGNGAHGKHYGLPRFRNARFQARFPFARVVLSDEPETQLSGQNADAKAAASRNKVGCPIAIEITGWSPFVPGDADSASLPVAALEYRFVNRSSKPVEAVFSFHSRNFMAISKRQAVKPAAGGFTLNEEGNQEKPWEAGAFSVAVTQENVRVNHAWFRGGWFDALTMTWRDVEQGACYDRPPPAEVDPSPGGTIFVPLQLQPGGDKTIIVRLAWYVGQTDFHAGPKPVGQTDGPSTYQPWYAGRFKDVAEVAAYWRENYHKLRSATMQFTECFYDTTLPPEVVEAVAANLTILKSPTVLRQSDGRLWAFEGCSDNKGCCNGTCTHVWNYAQALPHLFPALERTLRETEFSVSQDEKGHQTFRALLPIRPPPHDFHAAADGQLGGIMKVYREWRISGDTDWLRGLWPKVKASLNYCIDTWDPGRKGICEEPHHNTYDIEFWGPDGMCSSFYLGALAAAVAMGRALKDDVSVYDGLLENGVRYVEHELYNGDYFYQKVQWQNLRAKDPLEVKSFGGQYSPEALELMKQEGPKYQYGNGCLSDGVLGEWMAVVCGVGPVLKPSKVAGHLKSVHKYNLKHDLSTHANPQRPSYALGSEGGLLLCTWPRGGDLALPFVYSNEVWTGIEYQVASHLMYAGMIEEGLDIVRTARDRYDGRVRNPFNEYECGHWYARAMSSYAMLQGMTGVRYDAIEKKLYVHPRIKGDFRSFLATSTGFATVGVKGGKPFVEVKSGQIYIKKIDYASKA